MNQSIAYHEAGHAVVAAWLGAEVLSVTLEPDADDGPRRDGDAAVRWHHAGMSSRDRCQRELMAVLAGPVAEMIHAGITPSTADTTGWAGEWSADWHLACQLARALVPSDSHVVPLIEFTLEKLYRLAHSGPFWQTIAEVADLLEAYETIDGDQVQESLERWITG